MKFDLDDARVEELSGRLRQFLDERIIPAEPVFEEQIRSGIDRWSRPPIIAELQEQARAAGLWNLFLPESDLGAGLTNLQYAPLAEMTGWSPRIAPQALNCSAPDTGNMEVLARFGSDEQRREWLEPLLTSEIRSAFCMTEPDVASSDARNIDTRIRTEGDDLIVTGRKWWSSGAMSPECRILLVMGVSELDAPPYSRHSLVLVPRDTPGVEVRRSLSVFGYDDAAHGGHAEIVFDDVRVPTQNLIGQPGDGFGVAQARLGPGRIHHCMRLVGMAERALHALCERVDQREAFGGPLSEQGVVQGWIADARIRIEQIRLLVLKTAWMLDTVGVRNARQEIAAIKVAAPQAAEWVIDKAIQGHGGAGVSQDTPLAGLWAEARYLRIADGPDEVHRRSVARAELRRVRSETS